MLQSNRQLLILSGLLGIVIAIVGQAITLGSPTIDESGGEMATWLADNRALALTGSYLLGLGIALTIPLLVVIYSRLRAAEGGTAMMSATFLLTSLAAIAIVLVALGTFAVGAYRADSVTGDTAGLTRDLAWGILALSAFPAAIAMLAAARLILQTHALPAYIGYLHHSPAHGDPGDGVRSPGDSHLDVAWAAHFLSLPETDAARWEHSLVHQVTGEWSGCTPGRGVFEGGAVHQEEHSAADVAFGVPFDREEVDRLVERIAKVARHRGSVGPGRSQVVVVP